MPLGLVTNKAETRAIAAELGLAVSNKPDSQEICFVQGGSYTDFLAQTAPETVQARRHRGHIRASGAGRMTASRFTPSASGGVSMSVRPSRCMSSDINAETNTIMVGGNEELLADGLVADDINWVGIAGVQESRPVLVKIRYNMEPVPPLAKRRARREIVVAFDTPQRAVTPGQTPSGWSTPRRSRAWTTHEQEKKPPTKASVALLWKPPDGPSRRSPSGHCRRSGRARVRAVTPFPPDDRSLGWERGTTVSKEWDQATTDAALETAGYVAARLDELAGTRDDAPDRRPSCTFCAKFAERAFRRPLTAEQKQRHSTASSRPAGRRSWPSSGSCCSSLKSPRVPVPRSRPADADGYDVASRLSFGLWDSLPDQELLDGRRRPASSPTREQVAGRPSGCSPTRGPGPSCAAVPAHLAQGRTGERTWPRTPRRFPGFDAGRRLRPADLAGTVPRRRRLGPTSPTSANCCWPRSVPERPAGEVLRRRSARRRRRSRR